MSEDGAVIVNNSDGKGLVPDSVAAAARLRQDSKVNATLGLHASSLNRYPFGIAYIPGRTLCKPGVRYVKYGCNEYDVILLQPSHRRATYRYPGMHFSRTTTAR